MKALKFLKHMKQTDTPYNFRECEINEAIAELEKDMKPKTCDGCKYFRKSDKACFMSSQNTYIRPASIYFSGCSKHEPKDNK